MSSRSLQSARKRARNDRVIENENLKALKRLQGTKASFNVCRMRDAETDRQHIMRNIMLQPMHTGYDEVPNTSRRRLSAVRRYDRSTSASRSPTLNNASRNGSVVHSARNPI